MFQFDALPITITCDNERIHGKFVYLMAMNGESTGGFKLNKGEIINNGKVKLVKALSIGHASMLLGGGRMSKDDIIDMSAGIILKKKENDIVKENDILAICYTDKEINDEVKQLVLNAFIIK